MNGQEVISIYENVSVITDQMLAAARIGDWEQLAQLEAHCANQVNILRRDTTRAPLSKTAKERKVALLKKVLKDDRELRLLTEPWTARLTRLLNGMSVEHSRALGHGTHLSG